MVTYELPFGRGRKFGSGMNRVLDGILGGWRVGDIVTLRGGFPVTITAIDVSGMNSRPPRADRNGKGPQEVGLGKAWFDRSAFAAPAKGTFGNSGIGVLRGPGWKSLDLTVSKARPGGSNSAASASASPIPRSSPPPHVRWTMPT